MTKIRPFLSRLVTMFSFAGALQSYGNISIVTLSFTEINFEADFTKTIMQINNAHSYISVKSIIQACSPLDYE